MRKMVHFAVRLYPARWRARYGPEFHAVLEDMNAGFGDLFDIVKGALLMQFNRSSVLLTAAACGLLGIFVAAVVCHVTPRRYASTAIIHIEASSIPWMGPISAADAFRDSPAAVALVAPHVFSDEALTSLIEKNELYPSERRSGSVADVLHLFRKDITYRPTPEALQISFTYPDRDKAQKVALELVASFMYQAVAVAQHEAADERMRQRFLHFVMRVADPPQQVPVAANLTEMMSLGLGAGILAGAAVAMLRRRIQPAH